MDAKKKYLIIGIVAMLLVTIGFSAAYWTAQIMGDGKDMVVETDELKIIFTDQTSITEDTVVPNWETSKEFTVENRSGGDYYFDILIENFINTFETDSLQYRITSDNGYSMSNFEPIPKSKTSSTTKLADNIKIEDKVIQKYKIEFKYLDSTDPQTEDQGKTLKGNLKIDKHKSSSLAFFEDKFNGAKKREDFSTIVSDSSKYYEDGNYTENGNKVYYYAGNAQDNWVQFGENANGEKLYWRIIRMNEDESIRLLYAGSSPTASDAYIKSSGNIGSDGFLAYNKDNSNNTAYVGFMYSTGSTLADIRGNGTPSPIKTELETWYTSNLQSYDKYISKTAIYCNDRSTYGESSSEWKSSGTMYYNGYRKFNTNKSDNTKNHPSFKCGVGGDGKANFDSPDAERKKDMFSVSEASGGNGNLTKPIGLITADEVVFAGGFYRTTNSDAYYYRNSSGGSATGTNWWWTMSPSYFYSGSARVFFVYGSGNAGQLVSTNVDDTSGVVRPVISLKSCVKLSGSGIPDDPYTVTSDSTCDALEN